MPCAACGSYHERVTQAAAEPGRPVSAIERDVPKGSHLGVVKDVTTGREQMYKLPVPPVVGEPPRSAMEAGGRSQKK